MKINLTSIEYKIENGTTTAIEVGYQGRSQDGEFLSTRVRLTSSELDTYTRPEIDQQGRAKMAGWFTETSE